jgi:hypothetical protein
MATTTDRWLSLGWRWQELRADRSYGLDMIHLLTGAQLTRDIRPIVVSYGGLSETVEQPGWYPRGKGEAVYDGPDLRVYSEAWQRLADTVHEAGKHSVAKPMVI